VCRSISSVDRVWMETQYCPEDYAALVSDLCRSPIARRVVLRRLGERTPYAIPSASRCLCVAHVAQALGSDDGQAAQRIRALSKTNPALPYICRLTVFRRLMCPSTGPLLHRCVTAASTADSSRRMPSANRLIS
jgi:hypothetical protein